MRNGETVQRYAKHQLLVRFQSAVSLAARAGVARAHGASISKLLAPSGVAVVRLPPGMSVAAARSAFERDPAVAYAEPDYVSHLDAIPNDPLFGQLWGLPEINAPAAWDVTTGSPTVVVAVVDSGVATNAPDLSPNIWKNPGETGNGKENNGVDDDGNGLVDDVSGWDFVQHDNSPLDFNGHGTHVAGTIGARGNDSYGVPGIAWNVGLMPLRVADTSGKLLDSDVVSAFAYACNKGARVVNASFGGPDFSQAMLDTITSPACENTLFVAAAGNDGTNNDTSPEYPCDFTAANLVCVAASDGTHNLAAFSNYGSTSVDLAAPGTDIVSTLPHFATKFEDDFSADLSGRWITGGTGAQTWAREGDAQNGFDITDSPSGNYGDNTDSWIQLASPLDLSGKEGCAVNFFVSLATQQDHDFLVLDASTDGTTWTPLDSWSGSIGGSGPFDVAESSLSSFDGAPAVYLRFGLHSDGDGITGDGAQIPYVLVSCLGSTFTVDDYGALSGTSMAAAHVSGTAALLWSYKPTFTVAEVKNLLLQSTQRPPSMAGKTVTGGILNAGLALGYASYPLPETYFLVSPPLLTRSKATHFELGGSSTIGERTFDWSLDGGAWTSTSVGALNLGVGNGTHTLLVRVRDGFGRVDPTPAIWTWTVDDTPPAVTIVSGPKPGQRVHSSTVRFSFTSDDQGATFECDLDDDTRLSKMAPCSSTITYRGLSSSKHLFAIRATDTLGNENIVYRSWIVDTARCVVPDVRGKMLSKARAAIHRSHCGVGTINQVFSARVARGHVVAQSLAPGARRAKGARVSLVVSRGRRRR